jgi:hypothetical protein
MDIGKDDDLHKPLDHSWTHHRFSGLNEYVTKERNPENKMGVDGAEVFVPSPLLSSGMCFMDTPGLGSVFTGNTATTQAFIPNIDAALKTPNRHITLVVQATERSGWSRSL